MTIEPIAMNNSVERLSDFFNQYAARFNSAIQGDNPDIDGTAKAFADCFVAANPAGVICGQNDASFRDAMQQGYAFYKEIGITAMDIASKEFILLDGLHAITKVRWKYSYTKKDGVSGSLEFVNSYVTHSTGDRIVIFAYITGDEQSALKDIGLI
jgi:hypothetical protein